jgi:hypothetical protein
MKIKLLGIALLLFAAGNAPHAFGRQSDLGKYEGGKYVNDFFGLSFTPPPWTASSAERNAKLNDDIKALAATDDARKQAQLNDSVERSRILLSMTKLPPGTPANASLMLVAERVPLPGIKTPADVFGRLEASFKSTQFKVEFESAPRDVRLGGAEFGVATLKSTSPYGVFRQKVYITMRKGYSLQFFFTYLDDADLPTFDAAMKTVVIK